MRGPTTRRRLFCLVGGSLILSACVSSKCIWPGEIPEGDPLAEAPLACPWQTEGSLAANQCPSDWQLGPERVPGSGQMGDANRLPEFLFPDMVGDAQYFSECSDIFGDPALAIALTGRPADRTE